MKFCTRCNTDKPLDEFGKNQSKRDGKQPYCKSCGRDYNKAHYEKFPERRIEWNKKQRKLSQQFIWDYVKSHSCVDCAETDPIVLQFDHVRGEKKFNLSEAAHRGYAITTIQNEIRKCEIRCANCHIRQTASRGNWYTHIDTT